MGNHEYCVDCGEDDFHYGEPCDPAKYAAHQAELRTHKAKARAAKVAMEDYLKKHKVKYTLSEYGSAIVNKWDFHV